MSLETDVVAVLQGQCPRVHPVTASVNEARPFVTWQHLGGDPLRYVDGAAAAQRQALLQVNVWAEGHAQALALMLAIETALCGAATFVCNPLSAPRGAFGDAVEPPLYGLLQEFMVLGTR